MTDFIESLKRPVDPLGYSWDERSEEGEVKGYNQAIDDLHERGLIMCWRPIEDAPKDGTRILVSYPRDTWTMVNGKKKWFTIISVDSAHFDAKGDGTLQEGSGISLSLCTGWMPLPTISEGE